jgi:hypothetical protein
MEGAVLKITVVRYVESVDFGVIACERSVPHVSDIALGFGAAVADLHKIALEKTRTTPSMRRKRMTPVAAPPSVASNQHVERSASAAGTPLATLPEDLRGVPRGQDAGTFLGRGTRGTT